MLFIAVALTAVAALVITLVTPDTRVPVVDSEGFVYEEAERTLEEVTMLLVDDPSLNIEDLEDDYLLLAGIEGREPAGVGWAAVGVLAALLGALAWTRAGNRFGWYLIIVGVVSVTLGVARAFSDLVVHSSFETVVWPQVAFALADTLWIPLGVLLGPLLLSTFPAGRLLTRRWRWVTWVSGVASTILLVQLVHPRRYDGRALAPYAPPDLEILEPLFSVGIYLWMLALAAAALSLIVRFHRSTGAERNQMRWVAYGLIVSLVLLGLSDVAQGLGGDQAFWGPVAAAGFFFLLPLTFLMSVFRYRLFSIDVVINRTVVFGILSLIIAVIYVAAIALAGSLVGAGDVSSALLAMLVTAFAFEPIRVRIVSLVDRVVWRRGSDPRGALSEAFARLRDLHEFDEGLATVVKAVAEATNARYVALWIQNQLDVHLVAKAPTDAVMASGDDWEYVASVGETGSLGVAMSPGDRLRRPEKRLVDDLAKVATSLIENMRLRAVLDEVFTELEVRQSELIAAETRLREIVEETWTEVERDLHDGAQARAVALASVIGLARASPSPTDVPLMNSEIDEVEEAVVAFANGLHPATLREGGLAFAIREQARLLLPGAVVKAEADRVPHDISSVAYLVASEAMLNVAKHAPSTPNPPLISCVADGTDLNIVVTDEGPGFSVSGEASGSGLTNIRERVEALGGSLHVDSVLGSGTNLRATIPLT